MKTIIIDIVNYTYIIKIFIKNEHKNDYKNFY